jgi:23S rRNA pseudouridine955/2504/2580 synthase
LTLVRVFPRTGRGHQIRVHLQSLGHPIVADPDYGGARLFLSDLKRGYKRRPGVTERPLLTRMFLHAAAIALPDADGTPIEVEAPLPDDLRVALAKARTFAVRNRGRSADRAAGRATAGKPRPESSPCA